MVAKISISWELGLKTIKKNTYYPDYIKLQTISDYENSKTNCVPNLLITPWINSLKYISKANNSE